MSHKTRPARDAIAEQSLAVTLRKLVEGEIGLFFVKLDQSNLPEGTPLLVNPPVYIFMQRVTKDKRHTIKFSTPVAPDMLEDDKALAIALAVALRGFLAYEAEAVKHLPPDVTGGGGNGHGGRIIRP